MSYATVAETDGRITIRMAQHLRSLYWPTREFPLTKLILLYEFHNRIERMLFKNTTHNSRAELRLSSVHHDRIKPKRDFFSDLKSMSKGISKLINLPQYLDLSGFVRVRKGEWVPDSECTVHQHEVLHAVMDRLCEVCHEMFYHEQGNLRSQCRMRCFDNDVFRKCLHVFSSIDGKDLKSQSVAK
ncbi:hypothetical protein OSTOST_01490 [Ostertagia ostertagi]